jgi:hypothetical protein
MALVASGSRHNPEASGQTLWSNAHESRLQLMTFEYCDFPKESKQFSELDMLVI